MHKQLPAHCVSVLPHTVLIIEYEDFIKEWLPLHYPNATIEISIGDTSDKFTKFINQLSRKLVIMGA